MDVPLQLFSWPDESGSLHEFLDIRSGLPWDTSALYTSGVVSLLSDEPLVVGDFDLDGELSAADIDRLSERVRHAVFDEKFDLNADARLDEQDREFWIESLAATRPGDVDFDGSVDFADFLRLSRGFGTSHAGWSDGDFDGNGIVEFGDFLSLSGNFGDTRERQRGRSRT